jgi:uncharacterized protein YprB with RNaseH-like and TPR domain
MKDLADRLRGIIAAIPGRGTDASSNAPTTARDAGSKVDAADVLGGDWIASGEHRVLVVDHVYRPGHRHGRLTLVDHVLSDEGHGLQPFMCGGRLRPAVAEAGGTSRTGLLSDRAAAGPRTPAAPASVDAERAIANGPRIMFVDLETSGLAGGAGTYAFLVGCGWFEHCSFRVRQLFMSSAAVEPGMLSALTALAASVDLVISFNGKSFDLPLIDSRYAFHRRPSPFSGVPHLDMLHPARRLWRRDSEPMDDRERGGCTLGALETSVCGHTREGDVPGFEIPARYFHYVRSGDPAPLAPVFEHNRLDLLSLAFLTSRAAQLATDEVPQLTTAREAFGLGQVLERAGDVTRARRCYARAAAVDGQLPLPGEESTRAEAMHAYALLCRRDRRYADAATVWRQLLDLRRCPPGLMRTASEALAIHHEHRVRDFSAARAFALRSADLQTTPMRRKALEHRLARIDRKIVARPLMLF